MSTHSVTVASAEAVAIPGKTWNWENFEPVHPRFLGVDSFDARATEIIRNYFNWNDFFQKWGFPAEFPDILENPEWGDVASDLYEDVKNLYQELLAEKCLYPVVLFGIWKACSVNDHILVLKDKQPVTSLYFPRISVEEEEISLADYIKPMYSLRNNESDYIGGYAISLGEEVFNKWIKLKAEKNDYKSYLLEDFCQMYVTAIADFLHDTIRKSIWAYSTDEDLNNAEAITGFRQGIRTEIGKSECPDMAECEKLFQLFDVDKEHFLINDQFHFNPDFTACGYFFAHPQSRNFPVVNEASESRGNLNRKFI